MKTLNKKKKPYKGEFVFEQELATVASVMKCKYVKVPDAIKTKDSLIKKRGGGYTMAEDTRPCDGILVTPSGNYLIECKYNYGQLKPHQKRMSDDINRVNGSYYILRKKIKITKTPYKIKITYTIEKREKKVRNVIMKTNNITEIFKYFKEL